MSTASATEHGAYNDRAISTAARIHEYRKQSERSAEQPRESRFPAQDLTGLGVALEYEAMGERPVTEALAQEAASLGLDFEHLGLTLGTVIGGVDLKQTLSPEQVACLRRTLLERKVIFFHDQHLSEAQQADFARNFGALDAFPFGKPGEDPYILEIVHDERSPGRENSFHSDVTWMECPSLGSVAQLVVAPPYGGDTLFADSHAAYLGLPSDLKERIEHLDGMNDYRVFLQGRGMGALPEEIVEEIKAVIPFGVAHPLVRTHPETGKRGLYLNLGFLRHDSLFDRRTGEPIGADASRAIVARIAMAHNRPEYICRFQWRTGSVAFWDNRAVQHYASSDYYPHRRVLRRVTIAGDRPYC